MTVKQAPYAYEGLDRIFHEKARLGIVTSLAEHADGLDFSDLKTLSGLTDSNLSRHLQVLEEVSFVELDKGDAGKRPHTRCLLTETGRARFTEYLAELERVLRAATRATSPKRQTSTKLSKQS